MKSLVQQRAAVPFPEFGAERAYMIPFFKADGLPFDLQRWQPTVDAMLEGVETDTPIFFMLDQAPVALGHTLRRPGVHVDGHWIPSMHAHGGGSHGGGGGGGGHGGPGRHGHPATYEAPAAPAKKRKIPLPPSLIRKPIKKKGETVLDGIGYDESIILATNITGAIAYIGDYEAEFGPGNEVCYRDVLHMPTVELTAGFAWAGNVGMVHESIPMRAPGNRQLVRLNVPGWLPL